jgi:hypothetical protein
MRIHLFLVQDLLAPPLFTFCEDLCSFLHDGSVQFLTPVLTHHSCLGVCRRRAMLPPGIGDPQPAVKVMFAMCSNSSLTN